jgi:hypothetical protein
MHEQYRGNFRWRPTTLDLFHLALRDKDNRGLLFATRRKHIADDGLRIFMDARHEEPLLHVHCRDYSRLNPPYIIESRQSGERLGTVQAMAEHLDDRWYMLRSEADGLVTEFRREVPSHSDFTAASEDRRLGRFSFTYMSWAGDNEANVDFSCDFTSFLLLFTGWLFVMSKQAEDIGMYLGHPGPV